MNVLFEEEYKKTRYTYNRNKKNGTTLTAGKILFTAYFLLLTLFGASQGLGFYSAHSASIENRTSYEVFHRDYISLNSQLSVSFDLSIVNPESFGYIMTLEVEGHNMPGIYSLSYLKKNNNSFLKLNLEGENNLLTIPLDNKLLGRATYFKITIHFNIEESKIIIIANNTAYTYENKELKKHDKVRIFFGKHRNIIDVPEFAIRNLEIDNGHRNHIFNFEEDKGNDVHDIKRNAIGYVENPKWLINDSFHWKQLYSKACKSLTIVNFDDENEQLIIAEKDSITFFDLNSGGISKHNYNNEMPLVLNLGMSVIDNNKLIAYELKRMKVNKPTIATLNLNQLFWETNSYSYLENERHHHNSFYHPDSSKLLIFGGFGDKLFYNSIHEYNLETDTWQTLKTNGETITPRFFSGMGRLNDRLIIFGGSGNNSGDQSIGKKYYYDCYAFNLTTRNIEKLWEVSHNDTKLVSSRNLVFSSDSSAFYTIAYPEYEHNTSLKLFKYNLNNGTHKVYGDSIPMISEQIKTNVNLYINKNTKELYCVTQEYHHEDSCIIKLHSINNPPLSYSDLRFEKESTVKKTGTIVSISVIFIAFMIYLFSFIKKRERSQVNKTAKFHEEVKLPNQNAIFLFGEFTVLDRYGKNIAYMFSPQMKHLFLLLLQKSLVDKKGLSSEQMYHTIWPDREPKSAKNIKGVTINKIRKAIEDVDGIQLLYENKQFRLQKDAPFFCDYLYFLSLYEDNISENNNENNKTLAQLISRGQFLLGAEIEFLDPIKGYAANQVEILGSKILKHYYNQRDYNNCIVFARSLYNTDELNESAFYFTIKSLLKQNKNTEAKNHFSKYTIKYFEFHNHEFELLFADVVKKASKFVNEA